MPKNKNQKLSHPQFIVAVYKRERPIDYLFWHKFKHRDPRSLKLPVSRTVKVKSLLLSISLIEIEKSRAIKDKQGSRVTALESRSLCYLFKSI